MTNRFNKGIEKLKQADNVPKISVQTSNQPETTNATIETNNNENQVIINTIDSIKETTKTNIIPNTLNNMGTNVKNNAKTNVKSSILSNILDNILVNEPTGANFTFYLSDDVSKAIIEVAKAKKISKSKLVDTILKQVLLNK